MSTPAAVATTAPRPTKGMRIWGVAWRWGLTLLGAGCAASIICDAVQAGGNTRINLATSGVAVGTLVAFFADLYALFAGCKAYIRGATDSIQALKPNFWKAWVSATAIWMSVISWVGPSGPDPWFIVYTNQAPAGPPETRRISAIPALFINDATPDFRTGVDFNQQELDVSVRAFERIFAAFRACGSVPGKSQVELTITGYASSRLFDNTTQSESNRLNVETANRRAWNAYCFAAGQVAVNLLNPSEWPAAKWSCPVVQPSVTDSLAPIKLHLTHWPDDASGVQAGFEAMMKARPIQDWPHGLGTRDPVPSEELDRRVDFYLNGAGACEIGGTRDAPITVASATN